jgi:hypothetical protein
MLFHHDDIRDLDEITPWIFTGFRLGQIALGHIDNLSKHLSSLSIQFNKLEMFS